MRDKFFSNTLPLKNNAPVTPSLDHWRSWRAFKRTGDTTDGPLAQLDVFLELVVRDVVGVSVTEVSGL